MIVSIPLPGHAQTDQEAHQPDSAPAKSAAFALTIQVLKQHVPGGEKPWVFLNVENLTGGDVNFPEDRVHVEGESGEPPTTLFQRQLTHRLNSGERDIRSGGFEPTIHSGAESTRKYDLSLLYDLSKPGKYTVYIEVLDEFASKRTAVWIRSPVATFEIQAPQN